jgi:hypothetical protein
VVGNSEYQLNYSIFDAVSNICGEMHPWPENPTRLYDYMAMVFSKVAVTIARFGEKNLVLEWVAADVYKTCSEISNTQEERIAKQFPASYDRIYLSNIPYDFFSFSIFFFLNC